MQAGGDRGDRRGVLVGDRERRPDGDGPLDEQPDRRVLADRGARRGRVRRRAGCIRSTLGQASRSGGAGRPGTGYSCSPGDAERGPARGDDLEVRRGAEQAGDDRRRVDDLLEVVEDEQDAPRRQPGSSSDSAIGWPRRSRRRPTAAAIRGATSIGSRIGSSGTKKTPSGKSSADGRRQLRARAASCPVPPGPVRVSSRVVSKQRGRPRRARRRGRRTSSAGSAGCSAAASSVRSGGNVGGSPSRIDLDEPLGRAQVPQPVLPEVAQP